MENLVMIGQLLLGLSILIGLHELGHLLAAKAFGMRVEKFSIGFPPKIVGFKFKETEYSIGAIPLGGFVKISGMIDESLDTEQMAREPEPWEFRAKPAWQRLIVMMGGIIVNVVLGIVIFVVLAYQQGDAYIPRAEIVKNGIVALEYGEKLGLETGDKILKVNGKEYERFSEVQRGADVLLGDNSYYTIDRMGQTVNVSLPADMLEIFADKETATQFIEPRLPFAVGEVEKGSNAEKAGLKPGDRIIAVNGKEIMFFDQFDAALQENAGEEITLQVLRNVENRPENSGVVGDPITLTAQVSEEGKLGFRVRSLLDIKTEQYGFVESIVKGTEKAFESVWLNIRGFGKIFSGDVNVSESVKGPIGIREIYGGTWDWTRFWSITGLLSMWLAFVNFLPIPALDGGHVAFLTYEIISGTAPSDRFLEVAQKAGMVIIFAIMGLVIFNDLFNLFF
ncbi:RIP metalloprotease RseP [Nafulsella turpanensis]|uniref:RIP metalloprotease RseP n=1 Tax=Nafulsella turpanensis TaxID=1265690 RepID=UPI0003455E2C|nr:RIP metalloprotease RseP [Nafulsella turpanensis]